MSSSAIDPPLSQGVAYGFILGFGLAFAAVMNAISWVNKRYLGEDLDTGMLLTAKKSVKTGLVASAVVSSWCWAATILNSVRLCYIYGLPGLWWFCTMATVEVFAYAIIAIELKRRAPRANTILEAIRIRWGTGGHIVYTGYGIAVQILVTAALLLGCSAALHSMTGANIVAMNYLIPVGVVVYSLLGGLKATFLSDFIHTVVIFVILLVVMFRVMVTSNVPILGSPGQVWDLLQEAAVSSPAFGAKGGSHLQMESGQGVLLAGVILVSGFGSVFPDPSYGQKAIAGEARAVVKGYFIGAFAWFAIPLCLCSTAAAVAVVLQDTEYWPNAGGITAYESGNGLILPLAAQAIMGPGGVVAILLMIFMAVTSSFSAEIIAFSSVATLDIYRPYFNPTASEPTLRWVAHASLVGFAIFSSSFATALQASGLSMAWLLEFLGVVMGSAVVPITMSLTSSHASASWAMVSAPIGTLLGLMAWLVTTKQLYGEINVTTTFENWPMFAGCVVSLVVPLLTWFAWRPFTSEYNWSNLFLMIGVAPRAGDIQYTEEDDSDLGDSYDVRELDRASSMARWAVLGVSIIFIIVIPFGLWGYNFSRKFYLGWTILCFMWGWVAALLITVLPVVQSLGPIATVVRGLVADATGKRRKAGSSASSATEKDFEDKKGDATSGAKAVPVKEDDA